MYRIIEENAVYRIWTADMNLQIALSKAAVKFLFRVAKRKPKGIIALLEETHVTGSLREHAREGNLREVRRWIRAGQNLRKGQAVLCACHRGHYSIVKELLAAKCSPNAKNKGMPSMMWALNSHRTKCALALIEAGANVNARDKDRRSVLIWASYKGETTVMKKLFELGVAAEDRALRWSARDCHIDAAELLIEQGVDLEARDKDGISALMIAAQKGHVDFMDFLLTKNADIEAKDNCFKNALMWAAQKGQTECVKYLMEHGVNTNIRCIKGTTCLMRSAGKGFRECVNLFLSARDIDVDARDNRRGNALFWVARGGHAHLVEDLVKAGCSPNVRANRGKTALMVAIAEGHDECVRAFIQTGCFLNAREKSRRRALTIAIRGKLESCARMLFEAGATVEDVEDRKWSDDNFALSKKMLEDIIIVNKGVHCGLRSSRKFCRSTEDIIMGYIYNAKQFAKMHELFQSRAS